MRKNFMALSGVVGFLAIATTAAAAGREEQWNLVSFKNLGDRHDFESAHASYFDCLKARAFFLKNNQETGRSAICEKVR
jgi:hypothetical protein